MREHRRDFLRLYHSHLVIQSLMDKLIPSSYQTLRSLCARIRQEMLGPLSFGVIAGIRILLNREPKTHHSGSVAPITCVTKSGKRNPHAQKSPILLDAVDLRSYPCTLSYSASPPIWLTCKSISLPFLPRAKALQPLVVVQGQMQLVILLRLFFWVPSWWDCQCFSENSAKSFAPDKLFKDIFTNSEGT